MRDKKRADHCKRVRLFEVVEIERVGRVERDGGTFSRAFNLE